MYHAARDHLCPCVAAAVSDLTGASAVGREFARNLEFVVGCVFIFKNPGAWGQPLYQDSYYFPFEPARPVVAMWLAVTEATLDNGCLHVPPGSQTEPVHAHIADRRPGALYGYVEIVDHDMSASEPSLLERGDLFGDGKRTRSPINDWMPLLRERRPVA